MSFNDENWGDEKPSLFGRYGEPILNGVTIFLCVSAVVYFTLRLFEIIPNSGV